MILPPPCLPTGQFYWVSALTVTAPNSNLFIVAQQLSICLIWPYFFFSPENILARPCERQILQSSLNVFIVLLSGLSVHVSNLASLWMVMLVFQLMIGLSLAHSLVVPGQPRHPLIHNCLNLWPNSLQLSRNASKWLSQCIFNISVAAVKQILLYFRLPATINDA